MNNIASVTAVAILTGFSLMANAESTGEINFTGNITGSTCNVTVDGGQNTITLPTVSTSELKTAGQTTGQTKFVLSLKDCSGDGTVSGFFQNGATVNSETGRLIQTDAEGAKNISLELLDGTNGSVIFIGNQNQSETNYFAQINDGEEIKLPYSIRYYSEGTASSGAVASSLIYNLQYK
ncbi:fimbrial protein [Enterobacter kobei]|uniref:fimbrial protein n=1 Tax=Enterobacter kobei TaxID=208224 RepID=UPI003BEEBDBC